MKAVVTGGAGFIGSHLVNRLLDLGSEVHVIDDLSAGSRDAVRGAVLHVHDIRGPAARDTVVQIQPDVVFHLAAQVNVAQSMRAPDEDASVNVVGTVNMLEASRLAGVKHFIFASSSAVYGDHGNSVLSEDDDTNPISYYGISKLMSEFYIKSYHEMHGLPYTVLRFANVYGPGQTPKGEGGVVAIFLQQLQQGAVLNVTGDGQQTRDFIHVSDVVEALIRTMQDGALNAPLHVSTGLSITINHLVVFLSVIHGSTLPVAFTPERQGDIRFSCLSNERIHQLLGWKPQHDVISGLKDTYEHFLHR